MIEALTLLNRASCIKLYKNIARSRLFCRIAKRSIGTISLNLEGCFISFNVGEVHANIWVPNFYVKSIFEVCDYNDKNSIFWVNKSE